MLVADEAAETAGGGVVGVEVGAVAHAPDGALGEGGHELAVAPEDSAVGTEVAEGVVEGSPRPLGHAYDDRGVRPPGGFAQRLRLGAGHLDAVLNEVAEELAHGAGRSLLGAPVGIARQPRLGQDDEAGALARRLIDRVDGASHARLQVAVRGRPLDGGGDVGLGEGVGHPITIVPGCLAPPAASMDAAIRRKDMNLTRVAIVSSMSHRIAEHLATLGHWSAAHLPHTTWGAYLFYGVATIGVLVAVAGVFTPLMELTNSHGPPPSDSGPQPSYFTAFNVSGEYQWRNEWR